MLKVILLIFFCLTKALECYIHFGRLLPEWITIWASIFMINYLSFGFDWIIWLFRILNNLISSSNRNIGASIYKNTKQSDTSIITTNPNSVTTVENSVYVFDYESLDWITFSIIIVVCILGFMWPSMLRYYVHKLFMRFRLFQEYTKEISARLIQCKQENITDWKFHIWYNTPMISINLFLSYIMIQFVYLILPIQFFYIPTVLWTSIWCENYIHLEMTIIALLADVKTLNIRYTNIFKERVVTHFWAFHFNLLDKNKNSFGSIFWSFYGTSHLLSATTTNNNNNNKFNNHNNKKILSNEGLQRYIPILYIPWLNYLVTHFNITLYDIQKRFNSNMYTINNNNNNKSKVNNNNVHTLECN